MNKQTQKKGLVLLVCLVVFTAVMVPVIGLIDRALNKVDGLPAVPETADEHRGQLYYESSWYTQKDSLKTILFLGIDKQMEAGGARAESEQVDFLALLLLDTETERFQILHLNRDTMTDIIQTDITGMESGTFRGQLALSHAYGSNDKARCRNTVRVVENLLYGIEIDHYVSLTMDAVSILNDSVGGVTVTLLDDFTYLDPSYTKGTEVTLKGENALTYVRARGAQEDSSNLRRMERQRQYIGALFETFVAVNANHDDNSFETLLRVNEYMVSDCTINQLNQLTEQLGEYAYDGILTLEGEAIQGAEYMEYIIDEAAAQKTVVELFYECAE